MTSAPTTDTAAPAAHSDAMARSRNERPSGACTVAAAAPAVIAAVARTAGSAASVSGGISRVKSGDEKTCSKVL